MLVAGSVEELYREMLRGSGQPPTPRRERTYRRIDHMFGARLFQGRRVFDFATLMLGKAAMSHIVQSGEKLILPRGFWPACCRLCLHWDWSQALRRSLRRALHLYMRSLRLGATTATGMLFERSKEQRRSLAGSLNGLKCPELGHLLYDWFIDCLQIYHARVNNSSCLREAMRLSLIHI